MTLLSVHVLLQISTRVKREPILLLRAGYVLAPRALNATWNPDECEVKSRGKNTRKSGKCANNCCVSHGFAVTR